MRNPIRHFLPVLALCLAACAGSEAPDPEPETATETAVEDEAPAFDPSLSDPEAVEIARQVYAAMGGDEGFAKVAQLSFRFVVEQDGKVVSDYAHVWDRLSGRYRMEGTRKDGMKFVAYFNVNGFNPKQPAGQTWVGGRKMDDFELPPMLATAYGRHINDTYWLLMPAKLLDPGVILAYDGQATDDSGAMYDVLHVSFQDGIGLTPQDQYWAYINRETRLMDKWEYILTNDPPDAERKVAEWEEWEPHGPLVLATRREFPGRSIRILIADLEVSETVDEEKFRQPDE